MAAAPQNDPNFAAGGSLFGRIAAQWNQYFGAKVDADGGAADDLTLTGTTNVAGATFVGWVSQLVKRLTVNSNAVDPPTPLAGTVVQVLNADGAVTRIEIDAVAAIAALTARVAAGTSSIPLTLGSGVELTHFDVLGFAGSAGTGSYVGPLAAIRFLSGGTGAYSPTSAPAEIRLATTPIGATELIDRWVIAPDGGLYALGAPGGSQGLGSVNAASIAVNGVVLGPNITNVSKTADYPISTNDSGTYFNNTGGTGAINLSLPTGSIGLNYGAVVAAAQTFGFTAGSGAVLCHGTVVSGSGGSISSNSPFSSLKIMALSATRWVVTQATGSWVVN